MLKQIKLRNVRVNLQYNPSRSSYDYLFDEPESVERMESMIADGFISAKGALTTQPVDVTPDSPIVSAINATATGFAEAIAKRITSAKTDRDRQALTYALESWTEDQQRKILASDVDGVDGFSRLLTAYIANGYRKVDGLPPIDTIPCDHSETIRSLSARYLAQWQANEVSGKSPPSYECRARLTSLRLAAMRKENPDFPLPLEGKQWARFMRVHNGAGAGAEDNNRNNYLRCCVLPDALFPELDIYNRLALPSKDPRSLKFSKAFASTKLKLFNPLINASDPLLRAEMDEKSRKAAELAGTLDSWKPLAIPTMEDFEAVINPAPIETEDKKQALKDVQSAVAQRQQKGEATPTDALVASVAKQALDGPSVDIVSAVRAHSTEIDLWSAIPEERKPIAKTLLERLAVCDQPTLDSLVIALA